MVPCRTGNYTRTVSCCDETRWFYVGQETICEQFPAVLKYDGAMSDRKLLYANSSLSR